MTNEYKRQHVIRKPYKFKSLNENNVYLTEMLSGRATFLPAHSICDILLIFFWLYLLIFLELIISKILHKIIIILPNYLVRD